LNVGRCLIEVVVADEAPEGFATELPVLGLVNLLEQRALIPGGPLITLEGLPKIGLADVHEPNLQHLVRFGVIDEIAQPAPGTLELLEVGVMQDQVDLLREFLVELSDDRLD